MLKRPTTAVKPPASGGISAEDHARNTAGPNPSQRARQVASPNAAFNRKPGILPSGPKRPSGPNALQTATKSVMKNNLQSELPSLGSKLQSNVDSRLAKRVASFKSKHPNVTSERLAKFTAKNQNRISTKARVLRGMNIAKRNMKSSPLAGGSRPGGMGGGQKGY